MEKECTNNQIKTHATSENTISIGGVDFEVLGEFEKGDNVIATIDFNKIELADDEEETELGGNITGLIYKGKYYQGKVWLDDDTSLIVDTPYEWDDNDRVGIRIKPADIKVTKI